MIRPRFSLIGVWQMDIKTIVMKAKVLCGENENDDGDDTDSNCS